MPLDPGPIATFAGALSSRHRVKLVLALLESPATTGDLVAKVGLPQPRVSSHLAILRAAGIVSANAIGRRRVYSIDGRGTKRMIEEIGSFADLSGKAENSHARGSLVRPEAEIRKARTCYDHLAGIAGVMLLDRMVNQGWLNECRGPGRPRYELTPVGESAMEERGLDTSRSRSRMFAVGCPDGTEGGYHLGGELGAAVLRSLLRAGVVRQKGNVKQLALRVPIEKWTH